MHLSYAEENNDSSKRVRCYMHNFYSERSEDDASVSCVIQDLIERKQVENTPWRTRVPGEVTLNQRGRSARMVSTAHGSTERAEPDAEIVAAGFQTKESDVGGKGLSGADYRARMLCGNLEIVFKSQSGTWMLCSFPVQ